MNHYNCCRKCSSRALISDFHLSLSIIVASVTPVKADETAQTLWGDLPDPKETLEANGFQMRHVVLTPRRNRR